MPALVSSCGAAETPPLALGQPPPPLPKHTRLHVKKERKQMAVRHAQLAKNIESKLSRQKWPRPKFMHQTTTGVLSVESM